MVFGLYVESNGSVAGLRPWGRGPVYWECFRMLLVYWEETARRHKAPERVHGSQRGKGPEGGIPRVLRTLGGPWSGGLGVVAQGVRNPARGARRSWYLRDNAPVFCVSAVGSGTPGEVARSGTVLAALFGCKPCRGARGREGSVSGFGRERQYDQRTPCRPYEEVMRAGEKPIRPLVDRMESLSA
jgi:hypothetical protein